ncbi:hypothetical protein JOC85_002728 [Bacillus mesophilus]|nr:hypothetical protein [Bacillus mesophilus]MBM7661921.1 hypothetical protein [Bacillus mesophilus]
MKQMDLGFICFVGGYLLQDLWLYVGLPRIYYWELNRESILDDDDKKSA